MLSEQDLTVCKEFFGRIARGEYDTPSCYYYLLRDEDGGVYIADDNNPYTGSSSVLYLYRFESREPGQEFCDAQADLEAWGLSDWLHEVESKLEMLAMQQ
jgi:hypothetical protein